MSVGNPLSFGEPWMAYWFCIGGCGCREVRSREGYDEGRRIYSWEGANFITKLKPWKEDMSYVKCIFEKIFHLATLLGEKLRRSVPVLSQFIQLGSCNIIMSLKGCRKKVWNMNHVNGK